MNAASTLIAAEHVVVTPLLTDTRTAARMIQQHLLISNWQLEGTAVGEYKCKTIKK